MPPPTSSLHARDVLVPYYRIQSFQIPSVGTEVLSDLARSRQRTSLIYGGVDSLFTIIAHRLPVLLFLLAQQLPRTTCIMATLLTEARLHVIPNLFLLLFVHDHKKVSEINYTKLTIRTLK